MTKSHPRVTADDIKYLNNRHEFLYKISSDQESTTSKHLTLINAGGAVAALAYLGAVDTSTTDRIEYLYSVVALFGIGLIFITIYHWLKKRQLDYIFNKFVLYVAQFKKGEITFSDLVSKDDDNSKPAHYLDFFLALSLVFFCLGSGVAGVYFL